MTSNKKFNINELEIELLAEYYLYNNYYSKGILKENLSEGIIDKAKEKAKEFAEKLKSKAEKLKLPPSSAILTSILTGLKKELGEVTFDKIIAIADKFKGNPKDKKEVMDYLEKEIGDLSEQPDLKEGIFNLFRDKKTGKASGLSKTILIALAMLISFKAVGADKLIKSSIDKVPASTEASSDTFKQQGVSDKNIKIWSDAEKEANKHVSDQGDQGNTKNTTNTVNSEDGGKTIKVGFKTGEFKISDEDGIAKKIADNIIKQAGGKDIKSLKLGVKGLISNTPGAGDDDPNGPGKKGLGDNRLEAAKNLAQKVSDLIKKQFPKAQIDIEDDGTNVDNPGDEVAKNSDAAKKNQASSFTIKDLKTDDGKKAPTPQAPSSPDDLGYLRNPRVVQPDGNKLYTILGHILPLIIKDATYNTFTSELTSKLNTDAGKTNKDTFITRDYLEKKIKESEGESDFTNILKWAVAVDRDSKSIGAFINSLNPEIPKLGSPGGGLLPGKIGKAAGTPGSGPTQTPSPGPQSPGETNKLGEISLINIYNSLLTEASTSDFTSLPGYDGTKAKGNIGILVPIYCYTWNVSDNGAIDYVSTSDQYKIGWNTFEKKYPVIASKVGKLASSEKSKTSNKNQEPTDEPADKKAKTDQKSKDKYPFDKNENPTSPDIINLVKTTNRDNTYKQYLNKINTTDELANFILALFLYRDKQGGKLFSTDKTFTTDTGRAKSALFAVSNRLQNLQEDETDPIIKKYNDVKNTYVRVGQSSTLRNALSKINNSEEFAQFILRAVFPYVDKNLHSDRSKLRQAITKAANSTKEYADILKKNAGKLNKTTDVNLSEEFIRMKKLAGIKE